MKRRAIIFGILTALILCFIWGHSIMPGAASQGESIAVQHRLKPLLDPGERIDDELFHHYLRKAAHFAEYAALGFCMCGFLNNLPWEHEKRRLPLTFALCVFAAAVDECIQLFSSDRGPGVKDVLLDSIGALFGIVVLLLLAKLIQRRKRERS